MIVAEHMMQVVQRWWMMMMMLLLWWCCVVLCRHFPQLELCARVRPAPRPHV